MPGELYEWRYGNTAYPWGYLGAASFLHLYQSPNPISEVFQTTPLPEDQRWEAGMGSDHRREQRYRERVRGPAGLARLQHRPPRPEPVKARARQIGTAEEAPGQRFPRPRR